MDVHVIVQLLASGRRELAVSTRMDRLTFVSFAVHAKRVSEMERVEELERHGCSGRLLVGKVFVTFIARQRVHLTRVLLADVIAKVRFTSHDRRTVRAGE